MGSSALGTVTGSGEVGDRLVHTRSGHNGGSLGHSYYGWGTRSSDGVERPSDTVVTENKTVAEALEGQDELPHEVLRPP